MACASRVSALVDSHSERAHAPDKFTALHRPETADALFCAQRSPLIATLEGATMPTKANSMSFYPAFLDLRGRRCVVIGGGKMAETKARALIEAGAHVAVIGVEPTGELEALAAAGRIELIRRRYRQGDLANAWLAICCEDAETNHAVWQEAEERRVFLNAVDDVPHCSFIAGAIHRQGQLTIAISTSGKAPALAVRLRDRIAAEVGPEYGAFLEIAAELREEITRRIPDFAPRAALWYKLVDSEIIELLRRADVEGARRCARTIIEEAVGGAT